MVDLPLSPQSWMTKIQAIAGEIQWWLGEDNDLLGTLQLTLNKDQLKSMFPQRIEECLPNEELKTRRFMFNSHYVSHLASMLTLSSDALNEFLWAAGNDQTFSYSSSKYYEGQMFEEVLYQDWPVQTIALSLEKWLLEQIATAYWAISLFMANTDFMPGWGMLCPASPAFTNNSTFAQRIAETLSHQVDTIVSPRQEDAAWASEVEGEAWASYYQATSDAFQEQPIASTSSSHLDRGKNWARSPHPLSISLRCLKTNSPNEF